MGYQGAEGPRLLRFESAREDFGRLVRIRSPKLEKPSTLVGRGLPYHARNGSVCAKFGVLINFKILKVTAGQHMVDENAGRTRGTIARLIPVLRDLEEYLETGLIQQLAQELDCFGGEDMAPWQAAADFLTKERSRLPREIALATEELLLAVGERLNEFLDMLRVGGQQRDSGDEMEAAATSVAATEYLSTIAVVLSTGRGRIQKLASDVVDPLQVLRREYTKLWGKKVFWLATFTLGPLLLGLKSEAVGLTVSAATLVYIAYHGLGIYLWMTVNSLLDPELFNATEREVEYPRLLSLMKTHKKLGWVVLPLVVITVLFKISFLGGDGPWLESPRWLSLLLGT